MLITFCATLHFLARFESLHRIIYYCQHIMSFGFLFISKRSEIERESVDLTYFFCSHRKTERKNFYQDTGFLSLHPQYCRMTV